MKKSIEGVVVIAYCTMAILLTGLSNSNAIVFGIIKSLLMPALILLLLSSERAGKGEGIIMAGLFFSWAGDVLLLFEKKHALYFISGLLCFLLTHVCYIFYFLQIKSGNTSLIKKQPLLVIMVVAYGVSLLILLFPKLGEMKVPVLAYTIVICTMIICSLQVYTKVNSPVNLLFIAGALLFAASDSLLAINKFHNPFIGAGALIISTYCAAQFCIVMGVLKRIPVV